MREPKPCRVEGCDKPANVPGTVRDLCSGHYQRLRKYGDPLGSAPRKSPTCTVADCSKPTQAREMCSRHLSLWYRHGSTADRINRHPLLKHCAGCDGIYPRDAENFYVHRSNADGLDAYCKPCALRRRRAWLALNRQVVNARRRDAYWNDPEQERERSRRWVKDNPEKAREVSRSAQHRRRAVKVSATAERFHPIEIFDRDRWRCGICGKGISKALAYPDPMSVSLDHIVPLARGGDHTRANTQAAHLRCNLRKHCGGVDQLKLIG